MLRHSEPRTLPSAGSVGGVDVGWSQVRASSAAAKIEWDQKRIWLDVKRFRAIEPDRTHVLGLVFDAPMLVASFDGPLTTGLMPATNYRVAELLLTSGFQPRIGKPGQSSSPNGRRLNAEATECAKIIIRRRLVGRAHHAENIHSLAIVEAFPTSFLGVLLPDPTGLKTRRRASSDVFYETLSSLGILNGLIQELLPARSVSFDFEEFRNHDDRAAIVCALSSLCVAAGRYTAVGDNDGWIILPPFDWIAPWAHEIFVTNGRRLAALEISPKLGPKLGLMTSMFPEMSLEEFNATDDEIAKMFEGSSIEPTSSP